MSSASTTSLCLRSLVPTLMATLLAACASGPARQPDVSELSCPTPAPATCPVCPVCPAPGGAPTHPESPPQPPLQPASWNELADWSNDRHEEAWPALLQSCGVLARRDGWAQPCAIARTLGEKPSRERVRQYFEQHFRPWRAVNPDGNADGLVTGYYEPLIRGSRQRSERFPWPVHARPRDMLTIELGDVYPDLKNMRLRGRLVGDRIVPYWTRGEIERMDGQIPADVLLWAEDPIELFFLQVQGSGQVELPDGRRLRIGYADQNGHPYQSIGRWLISQGELTLEQASMDGIKHWAARNPQRLRELLGVNPSYVFFRELPASQGGPIGALGVPLTPERSIAVDPRYVPLGAPIYLATTYPNSAQPLRRLMLAQDTGGAIKGVARADFFWGFGAQAGIQAGRMRQQGNMWVLLPEGVRPE
ncbi:MAG: murein transglycosylase A [Rhodocyclaceae bacterium]